MNSLELEETPTFQGLHGRGLKTRANGERVSKHRAIAVHPVSGRVLQEWNLTQTSPAIKKARAVKARKRAKASRKANR